MIPLSVSGKLKGRLAVVGSVYQESAEIMRTIRNAVVAMTLMAMAPAWSATIYVTSISPNQVQVIVDGRTIRTLRPGEVTPEGVKLREINGASAVFEIGGRAIALSLGQSTVAETLLYADPRGHFVTQARFNGVPLMAGVRTPAGHPGP